MVGETARALKADADAMLDKLIAEKWLTARGIIFELVAADARDTEILAFRVAEIEAADRRSRQHCKAFGEY